MFENHNGPYQEALEKSGYKYKMTYKPSVETNAKNAGRERYYGTTRLLAKGWPPTLVEPF